MVAWERLIRFIASDGRVLRGQPVLPYPNFDLGNTTVETKLQAKVITGTDLYNTTGATRVTDEVVTVKQLLGPLAPEDVPILRCVGLNYAKHSMLCPSSCNRQSKILSRALMQKSFSQGSRTLGSSFSFHLFQTRDMRG